MYRLVRLNPSWRPRQLHLQSCAQDMMARTLAGGRVGWQQSRYEAYCHAHVLVQEVKSLICTLPGYTDSHRQRTWTPQRHSMPVLISKQSL